MRGRPLLHTSYGSDMALLNTASKKTRIIILLVLGLAAPMVLTDRWLALLITCCIAAIGAIGLGLITGYAGQVSLGHAFFFGIGAYTAAVVSGDPEERVLGFGITNMLVW